MVVNKLLSRTVLFLLLISILGCNVQDRNKEKKVLFEKEKINNSNPEDSTNNDKEIIKILKVFYAEYIDALENKGLLEINEIRDKYLTGELIQKINASNLDYDPIIDAQDADTNWLKTLIISKDAEWFKVSYKGYSSTVNIFLEVKKKNGVFKISNVQF